MQDIQDQEHRLRSIELTDLQAGGDVSRIVTGGVGDLPGNSVLEKMRYLQDHGDGLRRWLLTEPYGDPAMSIDLLVPPSHPDAQAGYIIMEAMGYPLYSGSNTICTATAVLQSGLVPIQEGDQSLTLESPAGLAHVTTHNRNGRVQSVTTQGEPAYVAAQDLSVDVPGFGPVTYHIVWSGAFYALVDAQALGFELQRDELHALAQFGETFVNAARADFREEHPDLGNTGPLPFAHFMGPIEEVSEGYYRSPSATYVHPGVICRSPTGTGTSARMALMYENGRMKDGDQLETVSPRGSSFVGTILGTASVGHYQAMHSHITGRAWTLAHSRIIVDLDDPLVDMSDLEHLLTNE
ncbi:proline racemase family protein [Marinobacteraceae bacterium S3BR75-40.1]